ncbi:MAG: hypothetical protein ACJ8D9_01965 [Xanthobacteraceae bacterium]
MRGFVTVLAAAAWFVPGQAHAAGAAYQVDTAEVSEAGACKVESWLSLASNRDVIGAVSPACAFDIGRPLELSSQFTRSRDDGEWTTNAAPKAKVNLAPSGIGVFGVAVTATTFFDLTAGQNTGMELVIPATIRLSNNMRVNLNAGWLWDRIAERHYAFYGAGVDLRTSDNVWTLTAEVFGQAGSAEINSVVQPRFQAGLRFRPVDRFNIDLIYGRNIAGENANWVTVATVIRFPPPEK